MNGILTGLVLSMLPYLLAMTVGVAPAYASDGDEVVKKKCVVVVKTGEDTDGETVKVTATGDGDFQWVSATATGDEEGQSDAVTHVVRILRRDDAEAKNQGWLGVMISATGSGDADVVTLTNIISGSPADKAGLLAGDVVVSVDGEAVSGDIAGAVNGIKAHKAGEDVTIGVLRDGEEITLTATLGSRARESFAKFEVTVDSGMGGEVEDTIVTRGRMLKRGDDGHWIVTELGDLSELQDLPAHIKMFVPQAGSRVVTLDDDGSSRSIHIEIKGEDSLSISQADGGDITVTRTDSDGNETVNVYADADELKADDEAAYSIFNKSGTHDIRFFSHGGDFDIDDIDFELGDNKFVFSFDDKDFDAAAFEWNENLEESLAEVNASAEEALERARVLVAQLEDREGWPALDRLHQLQPLIGSGVGARAFRFQRNKPRQSFEVRPDGTIEVKIRKGDTEVVQLFTDADDLADRKPKLYEKYREVMDAE